MNQNFQCFHLGVKAVIMNDRGQILLIRLNPDYMVINKHDQFWDFPGGRVLEGESIVEALDRRTMIEIGFKTKIIDDLGLVISNSEVNDNRHQKAKLVLQVYLCRIESDEVVQLGEEIAEYGWFDTGKASELLKVKFPDNFADKFTSPNKVESHAGNIIQVVLEKVVLKKGEKTVTKTFEQARRSPGTRLIIVSKDAKILLTQERRKELDTIDYRLPGGKVFDTLDEYLQFLKSSQDILPKVLEAGKKEAKEEVGLDVSGITLFHKSIAGSTIEWDLYYLVVNGFEFLPEQKLEIGEDIKPVWVSFEEASQIALSGKMQEDRSVAVLLRYLYQTGDKIK